MRTKLGKVALLIALCWTSATLASAEVVERVIARVNNHLLTWSDLDERMRFEALENRRPLAALTEDDRRAAFARLTQDALLREQMQGMAVATPEAIAARLSELRAIWQMSHDDAAWTATLTRYGFTADELRLQVANQLELLRFLEAQVRPLTQVSRAEVESYYDTILVPKTMAAGQSPASLEKVRAQIVELLREQKMNRAMEQWLEKLRAQSRIEVQWDAVR